MSSRPPIVSNLTLMWSGLMTSQAIICARDRAQGASRQRAAHASQPRRVWERTSSYWFVSSTGRPRRDAISLRLALACSRRETRLSLRGAGGEGHRLRSARRRGDARRRARLLVILLVRVELLQHVVQQRKGDERADSIQRKLDEHAGRLGPAPLRHQAHEASSRPCASETNALLEGLCSVGRAAAPVWCRSFAENECAPRSLMRSWLHGTALYAACLATT